MTRRAVAECGPGGGVSPMTTKLVVPVDFAVTTLRDAHDLLHRIRPGSDAPASEWLAFRRRAAQIYVAVADIDRYHHHEAMYWVEHEREAAHELATQVQAQRRDAKAPE